MTLVNLKTQWQDTPEFHQHIHELFTSLVNGNEQLNAHRTWIEQNVWGFGERSFWWFWKLILAELPEEPKLLEIGCFKGATLSLWQLLNNHSEVIGVTPLDNTGIDWEGDYKKFIEDIHDRFEQKHPVIVKGLSESEYAIQGAKSHSPYDLVYIDGGHERHHIDNDLFHYAPMVKPGGFLAIDDACCDMHMPFGFFQGIQPVTDGVVEYMASHACEWEFYGNVVHLRLYKKV